jgi:hypothetical protein
VVDDLEVEHGGGPPEVEEVGALAAVASAVALLLLEVSEPVLDGDASAERLAPTTALDEPQEALLMDFVLRNGEVAALLARGAAGLELTCRARLAGSGPSCRA